MPEAPLPPVGAVSNRAYGARCIIPINSIAVANRAYGTRCVIPINSIAVSNRAYGVRAASFLLTLYMIAYSVASVKLQRHSVLGFEVRLQNRQRLRRFKTGGASQKHTTLRFPYRANSPTLALVAFGQAQPTDTG